MEPGNFRMILDELIKTANLARMDGDSVWRRKHKMALEEHSKRALKAIGSTKQSGELSVLYAQLHATGFEHEEIRSLI